MVSIDENISFGVPYFESFLYHSGKIVKLKYGCVIVKYSREIETYRGFEKITQTSEIPFSCII